MRKYDLDTPAGRLRAAIEDPAAFDEFTSQSGTIADPVPFRMTPAEIDASWSKMARRLGSRTRRRPTRPEHWMLPLALAVLVLLVVGVGVADLDRAPSAPSGAAEVAEGEGMKGVPTGEMGTFVIYGADLRPFERLRIPVLSGLHPHVQSSGALTVTWRHGEPAPGRLAAWWVNEDGSIVLLDQPVAGEPVLKIDPPTPVGTLVLAVLYDGNPDVTVVANQIGDGTTALGTPIGGVAITAIRIIPGKNP